MARLVNKQFNTPIGLYSEQNIRDVIDRDTQILANGAVGVNFNNPVVGKPANLQNSAVLRMLEEEEHRQRTAQSPSPNSRPLRDQITWPPPDFDHTNHQRASFKDVITPGLKRVAWPPPNEGGDLAVEQAPVQAQGGAQYAPQPNLQQQQQYQNHQRPLKPLEITNGTSPIPPYQQQQQQYQQQPPNQHHSPQQFNQPQQQYQSPSPVGFRPATPKQWAPVHSPVATPGQPIYQSPSPQQYQGHSPVPQQYQSPIPQQYQSPVPQQYQSPVPQQYQSPVPQQYQSPVPQQYQSPVPQQYQSPVPQQYQSPVPQQFQSPTPQQYQYQQPQYQAPNQYNNQQPPQQQQQQPQYQGAPQQYQQPQQIAPQSARHVEPPPTTITLRQKAPVSQAPPPVVTSQPATATLKGGKHLRGDMKWPPEPVKKQAEEENRLRLELAKGPACRPRLVRKDYGPFFAQHALNASYPGYKAPPGTQFYDHEEAY